MRVLCLNLECPPLSSSTIGIFEWRSCNAGVHSSQGRHPRVKMVLVLKQSVNLKAYSVFEKGLHKVEVTTVLVSF